MDTSKLKKFAQFARRNLMAQVGAKLESVLTEGAAARREHPEAMKKLDVAIASDGKAQVIERVAYIWFNRFSALRFMDVNDLNPVRVVSPLVGQFQPEILAEAKAGSIDEDRVPERVRAQIASLLDGRTPSPDAQAEAYRLLLVAICNDWHKAMPFLFERIDDFTELLLPEDLLSNSSILAYLREAMTPDACQDVEVIGWLYQFYISEKKDEVFAGLKKNVKITTENIPAATQLFTPHWIVRYLVENSLGRLWMLNRPASKLAARMNYYVSAEESEPDFLRIGSPEDIKICDPACGSGHMLTYAFDLLYAIYEEEGYDAAGIPEKILTHNLYGIEIDERAGGLAAFALVMKAAGKRKRFLRRPVQPNICVLQNVSFRDDEIPDYIKVIGRDLLTDGLLEAMKQFGEAKNFGSLIEPKLKLVDQIRPLIAGKDTQGNLFIRNMHERVQIVLRMVDYLSPKYHVVIANPPYMSSKGMNGRLQDFSRSEYPESKSDLFAMFMERALAMNLKRGYMAMINMQSWMFLSSYEAMRAKLLAENTLLNMAHLGERAFDTIGGAVVSTTAFIFENFHRPNKKGHYIRLIDGASEKDKEAMARRAISCQSSKLSFRASSSDFEKIPGSPIAYWLSERLIRSFGSPALGTKATFRAGLQTGDNDRFLRYWHEVSGRSFVAGQPSRESAVRSGGKWFPHNKGGGYRKWYGNKEYVINWYNDGSEIKTKKALDLASGKITANNSKCWNQEFYFRDGLTWSSLSSNEISLRANGPGFLFDTKGQMLFPEGDKFAFMGLLNSKVASCMLAALAPTLDFNGGVVARLPLCELSGKSGPAVALREVGKVDWDAYETSWDFAALPLLAADNRPETLERRYARLRASWRNMTEKMQRLEEENNRIFIEAYGLADELAPEVPQSEITLTCNPVYRYGGNKSEDELEEALLADTMREFLSYAVGCMVGRYSLDAPGLILADQREGLPEYLARIPNPSFPPDADNVIPMLDGDWFTDDISERFRKFLRVTFGDARFQENLAFIEEGLGKNGKPRSVRDYFVKDFFTDHVKRYRKRPIYWLFSSPKGTFNALIYMHRYRPETVDTLLNEYLRPFRSKLEAHKAAQERLTISADATQAQRTAALKEVQTVTKQVAEIDAWERDVVYPLATQRIEIDLDDGVKANYAKFAGALKPIKGLEDTDD
jgi:type II restriction/modification system DNA methylase subunit YeeA